MRPIGSNRFTRAGWGLCLCVLIAAGAPAQNSVRGLDPADAFGAQPNRTVCPRNKPFKCENGDCVTNPTKCQPISKCPRNKPLRCADDTCVSRPGDCGRRQRCSGALPVTCPDGSCAKFKRECAVNEEGSTPRDNNQLPRLR